jgi:beta-mannosidase
VRTFAVDAVTVEPLDAVGREAVAAARRGPLPLSLPGCVHHALMDAGLIPSPDLDDGEARQEWVGRTGWRIVARLESPARAAGERVDLVLEEADAAGEVFLNGVRIGAIASEFVPHRFAIGSLLRADRANELELRMRGPVTEVERLERMLGSRPVNGDWTPYPFLRKSACNFGWDWGPRTPTVGIGAIRVETVRVARLASVRPLVVACDAERAMVEVHVEVDRVTADLDPLATVAIAAPDGRRFEARLEFTGDVAVARIEISHPDRWWPRGFGGQPLHDVAVELGSGGETLDAWRGRIGLRSVGLDTAPDRFGEGFTIRVNGAPVQIRGANWIPEGLFPVRPQPGVLARLVHLAADANLNLLRVWGGGRYESEAFLSACDELGILVWQDFMFACATYPEKPPYERLVDAEARHQLARHSPHPSVVLWCGGNEDILAWFSWGFRERLRPGQSWGRRFWLETLPRACRELDPTRPYWPESPWSGSLEIHPNDPDRGDRHTWDLKLEEFASLVPRFCSEFGQQSPPTLASIREALPEPAGTIGSPALALRQRAWGGDEFQYAPTLAARFGELRDLDEWVFATQLLQARHYAFAFHWLRANAPRCMGTVFWQWNDVWTGHSWSVLDARLRPKPAFFGVRRAAAPRALAVLPDAPGAERRRAVLVEAAGEVEGPFPDRLRLRTVAEDGTVVEAGEARLVRESEWILAARLPPEVATPETLGPRLLVADAGPLRATWLAVPDARRRDPAPRLALRVEGSAVAIEAETMLRDLCLLAELADPAIVARDGMLTLLPGERASIALDGGVASASSLRAAVRCANAISGRGLV